jgi:DNA anti-recombination protein RmuC
MNALIRKTHEVPVAEQQAIATLSKGLDEVKTDVRELRADNKSLREKIDAVYTTLRDKIDQSHAALSAGQAALRDRMDEGFRAAKDRMDEGVRATNAKMDEGFCAANAKIDSVNTKLSEKIEALSQKLTKVSDDVADMRGLQKATIWSIGGVGSLATILITMGNALHWF